MSRESNAGVSQHETEKRMDKEYIADAEDGAGHDKDTAKVFYGFGRTFSVNLKITF